MPLKASIGLSRKVGQENYGSLGANCQLEIELDASLNTYSTFALLSRSV
jgi:hypothetical protein